MRILLLVCHRVVSSCMFTELYVLYIHVHVAVLFEYFAHIIVNESHSFRAWTTSLASEVESDATFTLQIQDFALSKSRSLS